MKLKCNFLQVAVQSCDNIFYLNQRVVSPILADTLYWYLSVGVVITVVMTHSDQLAVVRTRAGVSHLAGEEIRETLGIKTIDVVDGISLSCQGVDKHSCPSCDGSLGNL